MIGLFRRRQPEADRRLYVVMRADLKLSRGKEIAQAVHASHGSYEPGLPVIAVRVDSEAQLDALIAEADAERVAVLKVRDAGRTSVAPGTVTCACIGPVSRARLPQLAAARVY